MFVLFLNTFILIVLFSGLKYYEHNGCYMNIGFVSTPQLQENSHLIKNQQKAIKYLVNRTEGQKKLIPAYIYQTNEYDQIPKSMKFAMNTIIEKNPQFTYRYYNSTERRLFIQNHMGKTLLDVYDKVIPPTFQTNIFRFATVYTYGGCYLDSGVTAAVSFAKMIYPGLEFMAFRDGKKNKDNARISTTIFCSRARHPILQQALNSLVKSVAIQNYGVNPLDITGTLKLTRAFFKIVPEVLVGGIVQSGYYKNKTIVVYEYVFPEGHCIAGTFHDPDSNVGFTGKYPFYEYDMYFYTKRQRYGQYYNNRTVFNKSIIINLDNGYEVSTQLQKLDVDFRIPIPLV